MKKDDFIEMLLEFYIFRKIKNPNSIKSIEKAFEMMKDSPE